MADAQRPVDVAETTEAQIAVHWKEEESYPCLQVVEVESQDVCQARTSQQSSFAYSPFLPLGQTLLSRS